LTLKGKQVLEQADVVLYDNLVDSSVLSFVSDRAELVDVGKRSGNHVVPQDEINSLLVKYALDGKRVVRLKGGDPFLFGRGGEEMQALQDYGIVVEVVPGVTSAIATPASAGIPLTHRMYASSVTVVTGHEHPEKSKPSVDWKAIAAIKGTLIVLMGVSRLSENTEALMKAGKDPLTPCALIERGTLPDMKVVVAPLKSIAEVAVEKDIKPPAVLVVGDVVKLRGDLGAPEV